MTHKRLFVLIVIPLCSMLFLNCLDQKNTMLTPITQLWSKPIIEEPSTIFDPENVHFDRPYGRIIHVEDYFITAWRIQDEDVVIALDQLTGNEKWRIEIPDKLRLSDMVYVESNKTLCLVSNGDPEILWIDLETGLIKKDAGNGNTQLDRKATFVYNNILYTYPETIRYLYGRFAGEVFLRAYHLTDHNELFQVALDRSFLNIIHAEGNTLYAISQDSVVCLDAYSGRVIERIVLPYTKGVSFFLPTSLKTYEPGWVKHIIDGEYLFLLNDDNVFCIHLTDKTLLWSAFLDESDASGNYNNLITNQERVFILTNKVLAFDKATGQRIPLSGSGLEINHHFMSSKHSIHSNLLLCAQDENTLFAYDVLKDSVLWKTDQTAQGFIYPMEYKDSFIIYEENKGFYSINISTGKIGWVLKENLGLLTSMHQEVLHDTLFFVTSDGVLHAVNLE